MLRLIAIGLLIACLIDPAAAAGFGMFQSGVPQPYPALPPATLNSSTLAATLTLANGSTTVSANANSSGANVATTVCHSTGKWYLEGAISPHNGPNGDGIGLLISGTTNTQFLGQTNNSVGYYGNGLLSINSATVLTAGSWGNNGATAGMAVDLDRKLVWVTSGNNLWNNDTLVSQNPSTGAGGVAIPLNGSICAAVEIETSGDVALPNFGGTIFVYNPPLGFAPWSGAPNVAAVTLVKNARASSLPKWCTNVHNVGSPGTTAAQNLTLMQTVGANCARDALNWDIIETSSGVYVWTAANNFDTEWSTYCGAGLFGILVATYNNPLYSAGSLVFAAIAVGSNTTAYTNFVTAAANHFIGNTLCPNGFALEYYNEPNLPQWTNSVQWAGGPYAVLAQAGAAATAAAQPNVVNYSGGLVQGPGTNPRDYSVQMQAGSTMSNVQQNAINPYDYSGTPSTTFGPVNLLFDIKEFMSGLNAPLKPWPITEHNYPTSSLINQDCGTSNVNQQGVWLGWSMLNAVLLGLPVYTQYDLVNDGTTCVTEQTWGLFKNPSDTPSLGIRPAGTAFQNVAKVCAGSTDANYLNYTYDVLYYPGQATYEWIVHKTNGTCRAVWFQNTFPYGTAAAATGASLPYSEKVGNTTILSAIDLLGNSVACSVSAGVLSCPALNETTGPLIITSSP